MKASGYGITDLGKKRTVNDDYLLIDDSLRLFVVCDGVGGHVSGNIASELCAQTVKQVISENRALITKYNAEPTLKNRALVAGALQKAVLSANEKIFQLAEIDVTKRGMCTTLVALLVLEDYAVIGHVGDSRVYILRGQKIHQLTEDHKYSNEMVKNGTLTAEEAARSPHGNVLSRAVGYQKLVDVDTLQLELLSGDTFLLCSDGLTEYFEKPELASQILGTSSENLPKLPAQLVRLANERGGRDNITALTVKVEATRDNASENLNILKKMEIVGKIPLFRYLSFQDVTKLLSLAQVRKFPSGTPLVQEGSSSEEMFIIAQGRVSVKKSGTVVAERGKGEIIGEMGLFDHAPRSASVHATEDTVALVLERKELLSLLRKDSQLSVKFLWALTHDLNQRLRAATENMVGTKAPPPLESGTVPFEISLDQSTWR